jgi:hypothetical protein
MADLLTKPRQLAPTMGQNTSGARIQAGSAFAGIGNTIAIGRVLYDSAFPIIPVDNLWVPAREDPTRLTVIPIGDIHIFIGETDLTPTTETNFRWIGMAETPKRITFELDMEKELSDLEPSKLSRSDLKANPTQPALEVEEVVDDRYESAMNNLVLETPRYCLVAFAGTTSGSASNGDDSPGESILEAVNESGESDDWDNKGYDSDHYDTAMKRTKAELAQQEIEDKQAAAKQVFMTNKGDDTGQTTGDPPSQAAHGGDAGKDQGNPPPAADPTTEQLPEIQGGPRPLQPAIPMVHHPEDFMTLMEKVIYGTLGDPITPDYVRDMNDLEQKRRAILKEAKRVEKMGEKPDGDIAKSQDTLKRARNMEEKYATLIQNQINKDGDPQLARNLEFTMITVETLARMYIKNLPYVGKKRDEVRAMPIEHIMAAKELLENNQSSAALETAVKLMTKALVQQEKATSSRRLESDPALCRSSTTSKARGNGNHGTRPDNKSHTGSSQAQRREARNRADAIPISSDDRLHGKGHQRNPSPSHKNYPAYGYHQDKAPPRHKSNMPPPKYKTFEIP